MNPFNHMVRLATGWTTGVRFLGAARIFSLHHHDQTGSATQSSTRTNGYRGKSGLGVKMTTKLHPVPSLRMRGAIRPLPHVLGV